MGMKEIKFEQKRALFLKLIKEQKQRNDLLRWIFFRGKCKFEVWKLKDINSILEVWEAVLPHALEYK